MNIYKSIVRIFVINVSKTGIISKPNYYNFYKIKFEYITFFI